MKIINCLITTQFITPLKAVNEFKYILHSNINAKNNIFYDKSGFPILINDDFFKDKISNFLKLGKNIDHNISLIRVFADTLEDPDLIGEVSNKYRYYIKQYITPYGHLSVIGIMTKQNGQWENSTIFMPSSKNMRKNHKYIAKQISKITNFIYQK